MTDFELNFFLLVHMNVIKKSGQINQLLDISEANYQLSNWNNFGTFKIENPKHDKNIEMQEYSKKQIIFACRLYQQHLHLSSYLMRCKILGYCHKFSTECDNEENGICRQHEKT